MKVWQGRGVLKVMMMLMFKVMQGQMSWLPMWSFFLKHDKLPMPHEGMDCNWVVEEVRGVKEAQVDSVDEDDNDILNVLAVGLPSIESAQPTALQRPRKPVWVSQCSPSSTVLSGHGYQDTKNPQCHAEHSHCAWTPAATPWAVAHGWDVGIMWWGVIWHRPYTFLIGK